MRDDDDVRELDDDLRANDDEPGLEDGGKQSGGCLKAIGCGCLALVILAVIGIGVGWSYRMTLVANVVTLSAEALVEHELALPPEEVEAVMRPIQELADKIKQGDITADQATEVFDNIVQGNEGVAVMLRGFETRYLEDEAILPIEQREAAALATNRFANGLLDGRIPRSELQAIADLVLIETSDGTKELKSPLAAEDVAKIIALLEQTNANHGVEDAYDALDLESLVRTALEDAL